jgi:hypothetical protein
MWLPGVLRCSGAHGLTEASRAVCNNPGAGAHCARRRARWRPGLVCGRAKGRKRPGVSACVGPQIGAGTRAHAAAHSAASERLRRRSRTAVTGHGWVWQLGMGCTRTANADLPVPRRGERPQKRMLEERVQRFVRRLKTQRSHQHFSAICSMRCRQTSLPQRLQERRRRRRRPRCTTVPQPRRHPAAKT